MKIRTGFISNSSSSSFLLEIKDFSLMERDAIWELMNDPWMKENGWFIIHNFPVIFGYTAMDNFDLRNYLEDKGIPMDRAKWYHSNNKLPTDCLFERSMKRDLEKMANESKKRFRK